MSAGSRRRISTPRGGSGCRWACSRRRRWGTTRACGDLIGTLPRPSVATSPDAQALVQSCRAALEFQMYHLFMDESGELGYQAGSSRHFVIAVISTADSSRLTRCIKKQTAKLIRAGWPKHVEIKGTTLWRSHVVEGVPGTISKDRVP